jgi:hypothetical protein
MICCKLDSAKCVGEAPVQNVIQFEDIEGGSWKTADQKDRNDRAKNSEKYSTRVKLVFGHPFLNLYQFCWRSVTNPVLFSWILLLNEQQVCTIIKTHTSRTEGWLEGG